MAPNREALEPPLRSRRAQRRGPGLLIIAVLVALYVITATVTVQRRTGSPRPLYDGFTPRSTYRFVDPPPFYKPGNITPEPLEMTIPLRGDGSAAAGISTSDGQFVVSLAQGAIAPSSDAKHVAVRVIPIAPTELPALADGLRANGNGYRITMTYEPSGRAITEMTTPGTLLLTVPEVGNHLFTSRRGTNWTAVTSTAIPPTQLGLSATFATNGYYLAGTELPPLAAPEGGSSSTAAILIGVAVAALTVALITLGWYLARRRRRPSAP